MQRCYRTITAAAAIIFIGFIAVAEDTALPPAPPPPAGRVMLPQTHEYQRTLRNFMATLTEKDFDHGVTEKIKEDIENNDPEYQYRMHLMNLIMQPLVGWKRGTPAVVSKSWLYLLSTIEGPETAGETIVPPLPKTKGLNPGPVFDPAGIVVPPVWPETLTAFANWNYPGNPFFGNRALKLRAFVTAATNMMMEDDFFSKATPEQRRADWNAYKLVALGAAYAGFKDVLPPVVQQAYEAGLLRRGRDTLSWGVKGEEINLDLIAPVGLLYAARAVNNPEFSAEVEAYARKLLTDPRYFHPAGCWVERGGGLDTGFGGMANYWAVWLALATDWPFAKAAVERAYRLRAHLSLPEPNGKFTGPSHFNSRLGTVAARDQWDWDGVREHAAAMVTDEAVHLVSLPDAETLAKAAGARAHEFNTQVYHPSLRNPYHDDHRYGYIRDEDIRGRTWRWKLWPTNNFPASINIAYEFCRPDAYARLKRFQADGSPWLKSPYLRGENFIRNFGDVFVVARQPGFAAIIHCGPVGAQPPADGLIQYKGPMGFGGGQLSAFWTPAAGSLILGMRNGMNYDKTFDDPAAWRLWPLHAVSGCGADGAVFTSARIARPEVRTDVGADRAGVRVQGVIPAELLAPDTADPQTRPRYAREFTVTAAGVDVATSLDGPLPAGCSELYETIPVFLDDPDLGRDRPAANAGIEFKVAGQWQPATADFAEAVAGVRVRRNSGGFELAFAAPQRLKLAATEWVGSYICKARARNIMIDLLAAGAANADGARRTAYSIRPLAD